MGNITENRIDTVLTPEALLEIRTLANQILALLPKGTLIDAERKKLKKVGVKQIAFLEDTLRSIDLVGEGVLPNYINKSKIENDAKLHKQLRDLSSVIGNIAIQMNDLKLIVGDEALTGAKANYKAITTASKVGVANTQTAFDSLKENFKDKGRPKFLKP
jgi:hypothetical protein